MTDGRTYDRPDDCPVADQHTTGPAGYLAWHAWAEEMARTHIQRRCPGCGFWTIWLPRGEEVKP